jgi:hypothetical protein
VHRRAAGVAIELARIDFGNVGEDHGRGATIVVYESGETAKEHGVAEMTEGVTVHGADPTGRVTTMAWRGPGAGISQASEFYAGKERADSPRK